MLKSICLIKYIFILYNFNSKLFKMTKWHAAYHKVKKSLQSNLKMQILVPLGIGRRLCVMGNILKP